MSFNEYLKESLGDSYKIQTEQMIKNAPDEVKQVFKEMQANAAKAAEYQIKDKNENGQEAEHIRDFWQDAIFFRFDKERNQYSFSNNYGGYISLFYRVDEEPHWVYWDRWGDDGDGGFKPMKNGFKEAMANASVFFTG